MRLRTYQSWTWVKALAVLGVLMHAGLLVRHAVHAAQLVTSDITVVICQGNGQAPINASLPQPDDPLSTKHAPCLDCTGATGLAVIPPEFAWTSAVLPANNKWQHIFEVSAITRAELPPPGRGPPPTRA